MNCCVWAEAFCHQQEMQIPLDLRERQTHQGCPASLDGCAWPQNTGLVKRTTNLMQQTIMRDEGQTFRRKAPSSRNSGILVALKEGRKQMESRQPHPTAGDSSPAELVDFMGRGVLPDLCDCNTQVDGRLRAKMGVCPLRTCRLPFGVPSSDSGCKFSARPMPCKWQTALSASCAQQKTEEIMRVASMESRSRVSECSKHKSKSRNTELQRVKTPQ